MDNNDDSIILNNITIHYGKTTLSELLQAGYYVLPDQWAYHAESETVMCGFFINDEILGNVVFFDVKESPAHIEELNSTAISLVLLYDSPITDAKDAMIGNEPTNGLAENLEREVLFRYSNRLVFYTILFGGWLSWGVLAYFFGERMLYAIGIRSAYDSPFFDKYGATGFWGLLSAIIISFVLLFVISFIIAKKITDSRGIVCYNNDYATLQIGGRSLEITYSHIKKIRYHVVTPYKKNLWFPASPGDGALSPPRLYRLHIKTTEGKIIIPCSFKEAWECKKNNVQPSIYLLYRQFSIRSGVQESFSQNIGLYPKESIRQ